ncbi:hypothetical protein HaLaN_14548, partial [Haematococcus lacustris]
CRYEEALNDVNRKTDIHQRGKTAVNHRAIIYARVAAAVRGCSFSLAAEVHTPKDLQRLLPYLGAKFMSEALFSVQVRDDLLAPVSELDVQQMCKMLGKAIEDVTGQPGWRLEVVG